MSRTAEAVDKFKKVLKPSIPKASIDLFVEVLKGNATIARTDTYFDRAAAATIHFVEHRMAASHLKYLETSQDNGIWGGSTTEAFQDLADAYGFEFKGVIDQNVALALVDGTIANPKATGKPDPNNYDWLRKICIARHGKASWSDVKGFVNIVGIRGYILGKGEVANVDNIYNDVISVAYIDSKTNRKTVKSFVASCDPGYYYYHIRPLNKKGAAHLNTGHWKYQIGRHGRSQYRALVQAQAVTVSRSFRGHIKDGDHQDTGWFGINIHAGTRAKYVSNASAGCQVIWSSSYRGYEYVQFMKLVDMGASHGQRTIDYNLLDSATDF